MLNHLTTRPLRIVATIALAMMTLAAPRAQSAFMAVAEIRPGMVGIGRTVYAGEQLEEFRANIIGVLKNVIGPGRDLILAKLEGGPLATTGVMQGMSGSPVYVDGRLIGAVAYSLGSFPREPIAGITPIAEMLAAIDERTPRAASGEFDLAWPATPEGVFGSLSRVMTRAAAPLRPSLLRNADIIGAPSLADWAPLLRPIGAALVVSGLAPEVQSYLRDALPPGATLEVSEAPQAPARAASPLRPGDPVGMSLVRGDMEMGATGTVTYINGSRVYAFGHPFLGLGPTEMAMTQANVLTVLPSLDSSMKIATMGPVIGRMTQDRATGVGGVLGPGPNELAVALTIESPGVPPRRLHFNVLHDQSLTPLFAYVAIFNTLNSYQRQSGGASIAASGSITFDGLGTLMIDDAFTGEQAVSLTGAVAMNPIGAIATNEFRRLLPQTLDLTLRVSERDDFATIERAWLDTTRPTLGGTHTLHVMLRQYRGGTEVVSLPITMPTQASGPVTVLVTDGPSLAALEQQELRPEPPRSVEALFNRLRDDARPGNQVYVRLLTAAAGTAIAGEAQASLPASVLAALDADASVGSSPLTRAIVGAWDRRLSRAIRGTHEFTITLRPAAPPS